MIEADKNKTNDQASEITKLTTAQYFSVYLSEPKNVTADQVLVFDAVIDDPDHLYCNESGEFMVKVPGVYAFTLNALTQENRAQLWLSICLNGDLEATTHANGWYDQASQTVTLALKAGDVVKVAGTPGMGMSQVYGYKEKYTTFTGRLVTPMMMMMM